MKDPAVTVLLPTIGRLDFLADTLACVRAQSFDDFEVLILDNASSPEAAAAFASWAESDPRVRVLRVEDRLPMFANFNRGIAAARGRYLTFFHDDDVYDRDFLRFSADALHRHPSAGTCGSNYDVIDARGHLLEERRWIRKSELVQGNDYIEALLRRARSLVAMPAVVFRSTALASGFDEQLPIHFGDFVMRMRIAETSDVVMLAESLVRIRRHSGQASQSIPRSQSIPLRTRVLLDYCEEYLTRHPSDEEFIDRARRRIRTLHRVGLAWGWATAPGDDEATACAENLGATLPDIALQRILRTLELTPFRSALRSPTWRSVARRLGTALGA